MLDVGSVSDDEEGRSRSPGLAEVRVRLKPSPTPPPFIPLKSTKPSQGDVVLLNFMSGGNRPDIAQVAGKRTLDFDSESNGSGSTDSDEEMEDLDSKAAAAQAERDGEADEAGRTDETPHRVDAAADATAAALAQKALALGGLSSSDSASQSSPSNPLEAEKSPESAKSPDTDVSASEGLRGLQIDGVALPPNRQNSTLAEPLKTPSEDRKPVPPWSPGDSLAASPIGEHLLTSADSARILPAFQPQSPLKEGLGSPQPILPPISNLFGDIDPHTSQQRQRRRQQSFPPALPAPSPSFPPSGAARSPPSVLPPPLSHPSPVLSQSAHSTPRLPASFATFYSQLPRRASQASETSPPGYPPALHSASTTDSFNPSSPDRHSPSSAIQSTPNDPAPTVAHRMSIDGAMPPVLPPLSGAPLPIGHVPSHGTGGFKCDYAGCTAAPFQTQYLLNSHANVHSTSRPHYCPVLGCPRAEGGRGFKRKNEMIRHGLVHDSPGYVCPFCPDREHRYPRPDNLQRHVRVHHVDKDRDDPQLREVLAQRPEGGSRGRRRRMT